MNYNSLKIKKIIVHSVGNKFHDEGIKFSSECFVPSDTIAELLCKYFISSFKLDNMLYHFDNDIDLRFNELNGITRSIFDDPDDFVNQSKKIATHLYTESNHPKIKGGELYVVLFDYICDDNRVESVIGIFKSENKDTFLRVYPEGSNFKIDSERGININRLDKGCLIRNFDSKSGYHVYIVDNTNRVKGEEAKYWKERFLQIRSINNGYCQTENLLTICREFISQIPQTEQGKSLKGAMMNDAVSLMRSDKVILSDFVDKIFGNAGLADMFTKFRLQKQEDIGISISDSFEPSGNALKKAGKSNSFSTIKLDDTFEIRMKKGTESLERGFDETKKMFYYKLYFKDES